MHHCCLTDKLSINLADILLNIFSRLILGLYFFNFIFTRTHDEGMPLMQLHTVFQSLVLNCLSYAILA